MDSSDHLPTALEYESGNDDEPTTEESEEDDEDGEMDQDILIERMLAAQEQEDEDEAQDELSNEGAEQPYEMEIHIQGGNDGDETDAERIARQRRQVMHLLQQTAIGRLFHFAVDDDGDNDDDDDYEEGEDEDERVNHIWRRRRRLARPDPNRFPKVPSAEGTELMNSGTFGVNDVLAVNASSYELSRKRKRLARRILDRELAVDSESRQKVNKNVMAQGMIPGNKPDHIIHYDQPVYSGQFSDDGNFFYSCVKDFRVRMYDTSNPYKWRYYKTVEYPFGQWTLTDASLSPDNKYLAYTSIRSTVCLAPTDPNDQGEPYNLDLAGQGTGTGGSGRIGYGGSFGIWSIRFSGDGRNLVAGTTGGSIVVYDIESRRTTSRIFGHEEDVNAVCFADKSSPHILYSGSDDTTLKVWDTRSMGDSREAGAFVGHIEGLTYIDSKGDGRYILSNGKDQSMKLWDLRMVMSQPDFTRLRPNRRAESHFDYRWGTYDDNEWYVHPNDNSLVTFRGGHRILRTLIRCHFSPPDSTNSRYVYTGSEDGKVYIYNMDATLAGVVDVFSATKNSRPMHEFMRAYDDDDDFTQSRWKTCVRDASWHPNAPIIAASAWSGYGMSTGTCSIHSWNDGAEDDEADPKMGQRVNQKLIPDAGYYEDDASQRMNPRLRAQALRRFMR